MFKLIFPQTVLAFEEFLLRFYVKKCSGGPRLLGVRGTPGTPGTPGNPGTAGTASTAGTPGIYNVIML